MQSLCQLSGGRCGVGNAQLMESFGVAAVGGWGPRMQSTTLLPYFCYDP